MSYKLRQTLPTGGHHVTNSRTGQHHAAVLTRAAVLMTVRWWLGTPWHHQASVRGVGSDCIGLIVGVARELGIPEAAAFAADPAIKGYSSEPDIAMALAACDRYLDPCQKPEPGDILYMRVHGVAHPQHFALISNPGYMIHAYAQARKVVENRIDDVWHSRIVRAFSYRGLSPNPPSFFGPSAASLGWNVG